MLIYKKSQKHDPPDLFHLHYRFFYLWQAQHGCEIVPTKAVATAASYSGWRFTYQKHFAYSQEAGRTLQPMRAQSENTQ